MKRFSILICLYKKDLYSSFTLQSILTNEFIDSEFQIYLWDNSPSAMSAGHLNLLKGKFPDFTYKHCPSNEVLSKLYNHVINEVSVKEGYLILFDDDTQIPAQYFEEVIKITLANPSVNLLLPKIVAANKVISPAKDYLFFTRFIKNLSPGLIESRYLTAINSGMVISNRVFRDGFRYDERLNFYGTDNYFMNQYALHYKMIYIVNVNVVHDVSFYTSGDVNNKVRIFKELKKSNSIIYEAGGIKKFLVLFNNFIVSLKLCLRYKTFKFLYD